MKNLHKPLAVLALSTSVICACQINTFNELITQPFHEKSLAETSPTYAQQGVDPLTAKDSPVGVQTADPVIAAAGDIACNPNPASVENCQMQATSELLLDPNLAAVLPLGDLQYERGEYEFFQQSYAPTWGRVKAISHPVVGNHEYKTMGASGYYQYFGEAAGDPTKGYYSYDVGHWHLIALNSNCKEVGGCHAGSPQEQWLQRDLVSHSNVCTLAYWHHPRFSSGVHGNDQELDAFWQALFKAGVEIVLNGHDHHYERFAPQTLSAELNLKHGIREFVVGTGGKDLRPTLVAQRNSEVRNDQTHGVLKLTLRPHGYDWQFEPIAGRTFTDSGKDICHI